MTIFNMLLLPVLLVAGFLNPSSACPTEEATPLSNYELRARYAETMKSFMNFSVDPCDDFYEYACGNWKNVIKPRQSKTRRNYLTDIDYVLLDVAEDILNRPNIDDIAPEYAEEFELAQKFYRNCLETDLSTMYKSPEYLEVLQSIGGFPAVDPYWDSSTFNWLNMSAHLSNYGIENLVYEELFSKFPYTSDFDLPSFGFDFELHLESIEDSTSSAYQENDKQMRRILSAYEVDEAEIDNVTNEVFQFIREVLVFSQDFNESHYACIDLEPGDSPVSQAIEEQWRSYLSIVWQGTLEYVEPEKRPCAYFYDKLNAIVDANPRPVANYLAMKFIYHLDANLMDPEFQTQHCITRIRNSMVFLIDHIYMKLYVDERTLTEVEAMFGEVKQIMRKVLTEADWLDEETRAAALEKEAALGHVVGRSENEDLIKLLLGEMKNLQFTEGNYAENNLMLNKFEKSIERYIGLHKEELDNSTLPLPLFIGMQPNAFNYLNANSMFLMAGVLHPPIFDKSWPDVLIYGTLGFLVGHEATHTFDTFGSSYDPMGEKNSWWSDTSKEQFDERAQCFIDQFDGYWIPEINRHIDGNNTRDENIADTGGLRIAYMTYRHLVENSVEEKPYETDTMPGLDLNADQLFFLSNAQLWCSSYSEANYWQELKDVHTIDKYRVLGMMSNNEDFAQVFNCPADSKLNPETRCKIW